MMAQGIGGSQFADGAGPSAVQDMFSPLPSSAERTNSPGDGRSSFAALLQGSERGSETATSPKASVATLTKSGSHPGDGLSGATVVQVAALSEPTPPAEIVAKQSASLSALPPTATGSTPPPEATASLAEAALAQGGSDVTLAMLPALLSGHLPVKTVDPAQASRPQTKADAASGLMKDDKPVALGNSAATMLTAIVPVADTTNSHAIAGTSRIGGVEQAPVLPTMNGSVASNEVAEAMSGAAGTHPPIPLSQESRNVPGKAISSTPEASGGMQIYDALANPSSTAPSDPGAAKTVSVPGTNHETSAMAAVSAPMHAEASAHNGVSITSAQTTAPAAPKAKPASAAVKPFGSQEPAATLPAISLGTARSAAGLPPGDTAAANDAANSVQTTAPAAAQPHVPSQFDSTVAATTVIIPATTHLAEGLPSGTVTPFEAAGLPDALAIEQGSNASAAGLTSEGLPHTVLNASPTSLEVGVASGTHGWLKVRAELSGNGEINASLTGGSTAAEASRLRDALPALGSFLAGERVQIGTLAVHAAMPIPAVPGGIERAMYQGSGALGGTLDAGTSGDGRSAHHGTDGGMSTVSPNDIENERRPEVLSEQRIDLAGYGRSAAWAGAALLPGTEHGGSGSSLNVQA